MFDGHYATRTTPLHALRVRVIEFVVENRINCSRINVPSLSRPLSQLPLFFPCLRPSIVTPLFVCSFHPLDFQNGRTRFARILRVARVYARIACNSLKRLVLYDRYRYPFSFTDGSFVFMDSWIAKRGKKQDNRDSIRPITSIAAC